MAKLVVKFMFGALPAFVGALCAVAAVTKMVEVQLIPSKVFGRTPLTFEHFAVLVLLLCVSIGGLAVAVAWMKEWRRNEEKNGWLIAGLIAAVSGIAGLAVWAGVEGTGVLPLFAIPVCAVTLALLRREVGLLR